MLKNDTIHAAWVVNAKRRYSKTNDEMYYDIDLINDADGSLIKTYVSEENYNYKNWENVIETYNDETAVCITGSLKLKKKDRKITNVINADSKPRVADTHNRDELMQAVLEKFYKENP